MRQFQHTTQSGTSGLALVRRDGATSAANPPDVAAPPLSPSTKAAIKWGAPTFLLGKSSGVDCSVEPSAVLTIVSGSKTLNLKIADRSHLILIGADQFSCSWSNQKVAVNYRLRETGETDVISLEIQ